MDEGKNHISELFQEIGRKIPKDYNILEEPIDVELQIEFFNYLEELKDKINNDLLMEQQENLFKKDVPPSEKKALLVLLSLACTVEAYRTIEKYTKHPDPELKAWSILALQEGRMLLASSLLDEPQVFISTGLGGEGKRLRYFVILQHTNTAKTLTKTQKKIIENEIYICLQKNDGILEKTEYKKAYAMFLVLIPLAYNVSKIFNQILEECNQYGNFLNENILITNIKKLTIEEIEKYNR